MPSTPSITVQPLNVRSLALRMLGINLIVLAIAWTLYWFMIANAVQVEVLSWIDQQKQRGYAVRFSDYRRGGFPLAVTMTFEQAAFGPAGEPAPWMWSVDRVTLSHPLHDRDRLDVRLGGLQTVRLRHGASYAGRFEVAEARLKGGGWLPNGTMIVREMALLDATGREGLAIGDLQIAASGNPAQANGDGQPSYEVNLTAARIRPPVSAWLPVARTIDTLAVNAELHGALPHQPWPAALEQWRQDGGTIELTQLDVAYGPLRANGTGTLALDRTGQPMASFSFYTQGYDPLIDALVARGLLGEGAAAATRALLALRAKPGPDGQLVTRLPLSVQDRQLTIGPIPLVTLPVVPWFGPDP